jgi:hypothetical protein
MNKKPFYKIKEIVSNINEIIKYNIQFNIIAIICSQDILITNNNLNIVQIHIIDETGKIKLLIENFSDKTILNNLLKIGNECIFRSLKAKLYNGYLYFILNYIENNNIKSSQNNICKREKIFIKSNDYSQIKFSILETKK